MLIKESTFDLTSDSIIGSKTNHCDGACDFLTKEASVDSVKYFNDLVPKPDHVYLLVVAMTAGEHYGCFTRGNDFISAEGEIKDVADVKKRDRVVSHDNSISLTYKPLAKEYTGKFTTITARCIPDTESTQDHRFRVVKRKETKCKRDKYKRCTPKTMQNSNICGRGKGCDVQHIDYTHEWVEAKNIKKGDFLVIPRKRMTKKEQKTIDPFSYDFARIFGYFLAEGSFGRHKGKANSVRFSFHADEIDYRDELSCIFDRIGVGYTITKQTEKAGKSIDIIATSTWLAKIVEKHCGSGCKNIEMSPRLFLQREDFMLRMIGAYINGDGHSSSLDGRTTFRTVSRKLLIQLKQILFSFGIPTSYHWNDNPKQRDVSVSPYGQASFNLEYGGKIAPYSDKISKNGFVSKSKTDSKVIVLDEYILVPVNKVETTLKNETRMVYNANIERVHSYQVNFVSVANSNRNGDYFKNDDLVKYHKIFESAGVFWNHDNKDKSKSSGVVTKSFWNDIMHRIELVIEMPQDKARYIPQHIEDGIPIRVSMGLTCPTETCSICGHVTRGSYANRCDHLKYMMNTVLHDGKKIYAISGTPFKIFDISIISGRQADKVAFSMLTKTASEKGGLSGL